MGIPICGGLHAVSTEDLCRDCRTTKHERNMEFLLSEQNRLHEEELDLAYRDLRRPKREAPILAPVKPPQPQQERRGL